MFQPATADIKQLIASAQHIRKAQVLHVPEQSYKIPIKAETAALQTWVYECEEIRTNNLSQ